MKKVAADAALIISIILIAGVVIYGCKYRIKEPYVESGNNYAEEDNDVYYIDEHELADFSEVIIEQFQKESELVVSSVEASVPVDIKKTGALDMGIFNKTQRLIYKGTGRFYVDLSLLGKHSISLDNDSSTVRIEIPHTKLAEIEINPDKFTFEETEKGLLAFGELKFTAEEYNDLQIECKERMKAAVDIKENYEAADKNAIEEMTKIYEPIVKAVDDTYHVEIVFIDSEE